MARISRRGSWVRVTLLRREVQNFKDRWPASGLPDAAIWFEFDSGGNLVDMGPYRLDRRLRRAEGSGALLAMSHDAWAMARRSRRRRSRSKKVGLLGY